MTNKGILNSNKSASFNKCRPVGDAKAGDVAGRGSSHIKKPTSGAATKGEGEPLLTD